MPAAVLRPTALGRFLAERSLLTIADGGDSTVVDSETDQIVSNRRGTLLAQGEVVFGGAALVGVAGDLNPCGGPATHPVCVPLEHRARIRTNLGHVVIEEDGVERHLVIELGQRHPLEPLLFRQELERAVAAVVVVAVAAGVAGLARAPPVAVAAQGAGCSNSPQPRGQQRHRRSQLAALAIQIP